MTDPALPPSDTAPHSWFDDVQGFVIGTVLSSLGVALLSAGGLLSSGTAGIAFLLHYLSGYGMGAMFLLVNLPFFALALKRMGKTFTAKSFTSVALLSVGVDTLPHWLDVQFIQPLYAAIAGGLLLGMGILAFVRHGSSLGGVNLLAVYLQQTRGWRAGKFQMGVDLLITLAAFWLVEPMRVLYSILGALLIGAVLTINHKPGRYLGF